MKAMFEWKPDMIRFMQDASEFGDYYETIRDKILPYITSNSLLCDAGCGLGYLSLALSPYAKTIVSVDKTKRALDVLEKNCQRFGINNIVIQHCDICELTLDRFFDHMICCFFGGQHILRVAKKLSTGNIILIMKNYSFHRFSAQPHAIQGHSFREACRFLDEYHIPYCREEFVVEFGQPFVNMADARRFFELYAKDEDPGLITDEMIRSRLRERKQDRFSLYLPHQRALGMIVVAANDIPEQIDERDCSNKII